MVVPEAAVVVPAAPVEESPVAAAMAAATAAPLAPEL
jgi:hypothetical protein